MPNFFYYDANGQKHGPINDAQLKSLTEQGTITPQTPLETESGHKGKAGQIPGLFADVPAPFVQTTGSSSVFCTNCGNAVTANAVACMSCGAAPIGHRRFCRHCGVATNPQQIICIRCGTAIGKSGQGSISTNGDESNTGAMWMHLTWPFVPIVTLIIWAVIKDKNPQANIHGKNILNAFFTMIVNSILYGIGVCGIGIFVLFMLDVNAMLLDANYSLDSTNDYDYSTPLWIVAVVIAYVIFVLFSIYVLIIRPIVTAIINGIAAGKGEIKPYKWAFRFCKT